MNLITMNDEFIQLLQKRQANTSIGPSTARGMGPEGTISAARSFLQRIDFKRFERLDSKIAYEVILDKLTNDLMASLPKGGQYWGSARKFLNIFLRGVLYNRYLCERYDFFRFEPWLEVPLDSHVAKGLRLEGGADNLPRWRTVISLVPQENKAYQDFAEEVARDKGIHRVHLDLLYWRGSHIKRKVSK